MQAAQILLQDPVGKEARLSMSARFEVSLLLKHQPCSPCLEGPWAVQMRSVLVSVSLWRRRYRLGRR